MPPQLGAGQHDADDLLASDLFDRSLRRWCRRPASHDDEQRKEDAELLKQGEDAPLVAPDDLHGRVAYFSAREAEILADLPHVSRVH